MSLVSETDKESLYRDGFLVLRNAIPQHLVLEARRSFFRKIGTFWHSSLALGYNLRSEDQAKRLEALHHWSERTRDAAFSGGDESIRSLVAAGSKLRKSIEELIGDNPRGFEFAQLAFNFPTSPSRRINEAGYPDADVPFFGWHGHLDGLWNGATAIHQHVDRKMTDVEWQAWNNGRGRNGVQRSYPEQNTTVTNFTALLGIPLSDQSTEGVGNVALLRGAHHHMEKFFQMQRAKGGPLGPDGPDWERVDTEAPNGCGLRHYPEYVREQFSEDAETTADGRLWPKPTLIKMGLGDAVLTLHAVPHSSTRCEGAEPRMMAYFRLASSIRPEGMTRVYPDALCDCWLEWPGMRDTVTRMRNEVTT